jgi:transposase
MSSVAIAVDLAKDIFELAVAGRAGTIQERKRLSRPRFERFWASQPPCQVVMEACSTSHFWARYLRARGFHVVLLPPHYVKPYRRRSKTDRSDCEALLEADRCAGLHPVTIKSEDQQALVALHRVRSRWLATRTARVNAMRGLLREFGLTAPVGAKAFMHRLHRLLADRHDHLPDRVRRTVLTLWEEVRDLEARIEAVEAELGQLARTEPVVQALLAVQGIGILTATALYATVADIHAFKSGRQLACWLGLTPREFSSGGRRRLGRISKQGDPYVRMLLIHGARAALQAARRREKAGLPLTRLQEWALQRARDSHPNRAGVALANKLARIAWAVWYHERPFDGNHAARVAA